MASTLQDMRMKHGTVEKPNRALGAIIAIAFQALIVWGLIVGLAISQGVTLKDLEAAVIQEDKTDTPPPPPPVDFKPPPAVIAPPEVSIDITDTAPTTAIQNVQAKDPNAAVTSPKGSNRNRITSSDYPDLSRRLSEQGTTVLKITIDTSGTVVEADVVKSSGYQRLDEAAVNMVKNKWHYTPAMQYGKPIQFTANINIVWKLSGL